MSARKSWRPVVILAATTSAAACDGFIRPPDPLELHLDVVSVAILLVAGESEARLLATHPHRPDGAGVPGISATLLGPGWTAAFSETLEPESCLRRTLGFGPAQCLSAPLPEPVRAATAYGITGTAPLGSFSGETTVPASPVLLDPADTLKLQAYTDRSALKIPILYESNAGIGTLLAEVLDVFRTEDDGTETNGDARDLGLFPQRIDGPGTDTLVAFYRDRPVRFSLRLTGLGRQYTDFIDQSGRYPVPKPWPSFGIEGEGVYGYFSGAASSRAVQVRLSRQ